MDSGAYAKSQLQNAEVKGDEIPIHAKKEVIEALQDLEDEYDLHPKHAIWKKNHSWSTLTGTVNIESTSSHSELGPIPKLCFHMNHLSSLSLLCR